MQRLRVLLVQLASAGDCLFVTTIAKQIKEVDFPGCHLTWLIGSYYTNVINNNPYIDDIIEIPMTGIEDNTKNRELIDVHIAMTGGHRKFDKIFVTDYIVKNYKNWFGTTRSSLFRSYPHKLRINPQPLIYLSEIEKDRVAVFCRKYDLTDNTFNVLFECSPKSGQSLMTFHLAKKIADELVAYNSNFRIILSSNTSFNSDAHNIIDGSEISWRENAELANYCHLLVGCSSGISWLCTSNWTRRIPFIQVIDPRYMSGQFSASMKIDFIYFGIDTEKLIELYNPSEYTLKECIIASSLNRFEVAKRNFDVKDNTSFGNLRFLREARISKYKKANLFLKYGLMQFLFRTYKKVKPNWFTPRVWYKNIH